VQLAKHDFFNTKTELGIMIEGRALPENAWSSMHSNLEPGSNVTD
jgi:hypothetical protein